MLNLKVRTAVLQDIKSVVKIQKILALNRDNKDEYSKKGFLVYKAEAGELKKIINNKQVIFLVAENAKGVIGYALAYDLDLWKVNKQKWEKQIKLIETLPKKILYFRHVARLEGFNGAGNLLEKEIEERSKKLGYKFILGEILERPIPNLKSKEVHESRGFTKIGTIDYQDGLLWAVYIKKL